jgi:epoxyqueuosine reductase
MEGMPWFTPQRVEAAADLGRRHPWARSILSLAFPYRPARLGGASPPAAEEGRPRGRFSAYVCLDGGDGAVDYHALLARRCDALAAWLQDRVPDLRAKCLVDHGWTFDRAIAERAGVGFIGRSSALITREAGSYVLLAELLLSVPLPPTARSRRSCGGCRACLAACPTGALVGPGAVDARRCISYLTIEHRGQLDTGLRPLIGTWAFGCDVCQEACPINARLAPPALEEERAATDHGPVPFPDLVECLGLDDAEFSRRFRSTAVRRAGRARLARNCAVALGNAGDPAALPALRRAAATDPDATVRDAARWATEHLTNAAGRFPLL